MSRNKAAWIGFVVASVIPAAVLAVLRPLSGTWDGVSISGTFLVFYGFSAAATVVFGVPTFLLLRRVELITWWVTPLAGFIDGALVGLVLRLPSPPNPQDVLFLGLIGLVCALVFFAIWIRADTP